MVIQPVEFALVNRLNTCQANIIKYVCRFRAKGGAIDLEKAAHYCLLWVEFAARYRQTVFKPWAIQPVFVISPEEFVAANGLGRVEAQIIDRVCYADGAPDALEAHELIIQLLGEFNERD
jgi:hypothetical protein